VRLLGSRVERKKVAKKECPFLTLSPSPWHRSRRLLFAMSTTVSHRGMTIPINTPGLLAGRFGTIPANSSPWTLWIPASLQTLFSRLPSGGMRRLPWCASLLLIVRKHPMPMALLAMEGRGFSTPKY
jgi:hypothetical protein